MPPNLVIACFVLGAVLVLVALLGGRFKIFGAEVSERAGVFPRVLAGAGGVFLLVLALAAEEKDPAHGKELDRPAHDEPAPAAPMPPAPPALKPAVQPELDLEADAVVVNTVANPVAGDPTWTNLMARCYMEGGSEGYCMCFLQRAQAGYSPAQYTALELRTYQGDMVAATQLLQLVQSCM